jgi:hypothetical protein
MRSRTNTRTNEPTHFTFHACSKKASLSRSTSRLRFELKVAIALSDTSRMRSVAPSPPVVCASRASAGAALLASRAGTGEVGGTSARGLARVAWRRLG